MESVVRLVNFFSRCGTLRLPQVSSICLGGRLLRLTPPLFQLKIKYEPNTTSLPHLLLKLSHHFFLAPCSVAILAAQTQVLSQPHKHHGTVNDGLDVRKPAKEVQVSSVIGSIASYGD